MGLQRRTIAVFLLGMIVGAATAGVTVTLLLGSRTTFVLTEDLVLTAPGHAISGVLRAGTRFNVVGQKADVSYLEFNTAATASELLGRAKCAEPCPGTPWDNWEQWRRSQQSAHAPGTR